jgi:hypothetical protein
MDQECDERRRFGFRGLVFCLEATIEAVEAEAVLMLDLTAASYRKLDSTQGRTAAANTLHITVMAAPGHEPIPKAHLGV